jgi:hypothetical protein
VSLNPAALPLGFIITHVLPLIEKWNILFPIVSRIFLLRCSAPLLPEAQGLIHLHQKRVRNCKNTIRQNSIFKYLCIPSVTSFELKDIRWGIPFSKLRTGKNSAVFSLRGNGCVTS